MADQLYPRWIPNPRPEGKEIKVQTPEEHARVNPKDYDDLQNEIEEKSKLPTDHTAVELARLDERERCARIAETFPKANWVGRGIATAIRGKDKPAEPAPPPVMQPPPSPPAPEPTPPLVVEESLSETK